MGRPSKFAKSVLGVFLAAAALGAAALVFRPENPAFASPVLAEIDPAAVQQSVGRAHAQAREGAVAGVIPHHFVARDLMADLAASMRHARPSTIVIVGPDHQNAGERFFTVGSASWRGPNGVYAPDRAVVASLQELASVAINNDLLRTEHSALVPLPIFAAFFPKARYVLITVREGYDPDRIREVAGVLHAALGADDIVVASVDFSHYQSSVDALKDDAVSIQAIQSGNPASLVSLAVDSPSSLAHAIEFARLRSASVRTLIGHSTSALVLGDPSMNATTSYQTWIFSRP